MRIIHIQRRLWFLLLLCLCCLFTANAQQALPTDASLKKLVEKYIQTPVKKIIQPNGDVFLQRNFSSFLHAAPVPAGVAGTPDYGHQHDYMALETFLNRPHPSVATLQKYFAEAAVEFGVPAMLLQAYAQVQSNWAQVSNSMYGSWGIMGLIENNHVQQISEAARLLGIESDDIKTNAQQNIRAAAALLASYRPAAATASTPEYWYKSTQQLTGLQDEAMQISLSNRIFSTLQGGSKTISIWGEIILLPPQQNYALPEQIQSTTGSQQTLGNGTPDYPGAIYNLTNTNFNNRPSGANINFYFVHYIAVGTYEGTISWFKNSASQVSAHYVVRNSDGQITQVVDEANRAWSQGVTEYNDQGIGVEHEVLVSNLSMWNSPPMLQAAGSLAADVCNRNLIPKQRRVNNGDRGIYGHSDVRATDCPNLTTERWSALLSQIAGALPGVGTPTLLSISGGSGSAAVNARWKANTDPSLLGYRLYYATNDALNNWALAADETTLTATSTQISLLPSQFKVIPSQPAHHFKLTALVPNGTSPVVESAPSDVYSRSWMVTGPKVLLVDGFDRSSGSYTSSTHSFAASYAKALRQQGLVEINTVANEQVENDSTTLNGYNIVIWFTGDESSANVVFSAAEKAAITKYLNSGGKMLISGSEIAYNIGRSASAAYDLAFMNNYLKSNYVDDGNASYNPATGVIASPFEGLNMPFGVVYPEDFPDNIATVGGSSYILQYAGGTANAGVAYKGNFSGGTQPGAMVYVGFPIETATDTDISLFMNKLLPYFDVPRIPAPPIAIADVATTSSGKAKRMSILANDNGNGNTINTKSVLINKPPAHGNATTTADGSIIYVAASGYTGNDQFTYSVASSAGIYSNEAIVSITVLDAGQCTDTPPEVDDNYPLRDMRGAWVSTVSNIDWPSSRTLSTSQQQTELLRILDTLRSTGINTVFLQVRPESDALYASSYEPWSYWLTNAQGTAPNPLWDPLQFAINAAHERGMDLHAWLNPYRAKQSTPVLAANHVANQHPDWTFISGTLTMLNPGLPEVRNHIVKVIGDIANRYQVDGIHFDDYFYPYAGMTGQDAATFTTHNPTNIATIEDWRRNNVNQLVAMVYDTLQKVNAAQNKNIVFGISPFGIWKSGTPAGITGTSSYSQFYCDPIAWLQAGTVDYLSPQLYWKITGAQDYDKLSAWWNNRGAQYGKHIYPGLALYKMTDANNWEAAEIQQQINLNRDALRNQTLGQVMFSTKQIMANNKGIKTQLQANQYRFASYAPAMPWKDSVCPNSPTNVIIDGDTLRWQAPPPAADGDMARRYVVYRFDKDAEANTHANDGSRVVAIVASTNLYQPNAGFGRYVVSALDKNNNESTGTLSQLPNVLLCPNGSTTLSSLVAGATFSWQILLENSWSPIDNPSWFSGTNTATLSITNLPISFYGTQIRCVADGNKVGSAYTITFGTVWTGAVSDAWSNTDNWNCGVIPNLQLDAIIPASVPHFPRVNVAEANARTVLLRYGASITVLPGNQLKISKE